MVVVVVMVMPGHSETLAFCSIPGVGPHKAGHTRSKQHDEMHGSLEIISPDGKNLTI